MYRIDDPSASATLPTPEAALTEGYWTEGNPGSGIPATLERASWFNMIQEELRAIVVAAGLTPSKTTYNQVLSAIKSMYSPVIGAASNLKCSLTTAATTATWTADEIVVGAALGGQTYKLSNYSKTINIGTTGAGGMDTGSAPTSGWIALYAIYNPTTGATNILATNATSTVAPTVYGGANMPAGYTASALISVWRITGATLLYAGYQTGNTVIFLGISTLSVTVTQASMTSFSISSVAPPNAKTAFGSINAQAVGATSIGAGIAASSTSFGSQSGLVAGSSLAQVLNQFNVPIITSQTLYYTFAMTGGSSPSLTVNGVGYTF